MKTKLLRKIRRRFKWRYIHKYKTWIITNRTTQYVDSTPKSTHDAVTYMATNVLKRSWLDRIIGV